MMKRAGVPRLGPDDPSQMQTQNTAQLQQASTSNMNLSHALQQPQVTQQQLLGNPTMMSVGGGGFGRGGVRAPSVPNAGPPVINYMKPGGVQYVPTKQPPPQGPPRIKQQAPQPNVVPGRQSPGPQTQFQRLKVEDALSYLDQVKFKFNTQPQVYNDFLDIMKEFKSQTIDTPGVITRVSNLFKGHSELIVGFNTFLPPGYKIEVKSDGQVSVSMPSPTGMGGGVLLGVHHPPQQQLVHLLPVAQPVTSAIVHNLSVSAPGTNTLHQISHAHQQMEAAVHHAPGGPQGAPTPPGQPVEFNHAIEYVNKIKSRFSRQPDKYKRFLEILHAYQRGQRDIKEPQAKQQTEQEVYSQVAKLFENQEDLLAEFGQFLPDAKAVKATPDRPLTPPMQPTRIESDERFLPVQSVSPPHHHTPIQHPQIPKHTNTVSSIVQPVQHHHLKRSPNFTSSGPPPSLPTGVTASSVNVSPAVGGAPTGLSQAGVTTGGPPAKRARSSALTGPCVRDVTFAEAAKFATHHEYSFFDRTRKALRSQHVYDNFLRCLLLFTNEIISSSELLSVTAPFLCRHPELHKWLQDFVGPPSPPHTPTTTNSSINTGYTWACTAAGSVSGNVSGSLSSVLEGRTRYEPVGPLGAQLRHDRPQPDIAMDIDLSTCKRLGTSYCALPRSANPPRCSGRTPLCKEVLNDTWVSFPTWSEDSTFVTSRKTQYEEYIYRCEDERFELDVVIETNASTIRVLDGVHKKMLRMLPDESNKYRLDDCLGGHSPTIHQRTLRRIYGDKVAVDIIAGLKKNPSIAIPVVLRRLKAKEEEWREAQKGFNKQWREQNEKYYLKSLDHQGINFKQNDLKAMRSKTLFNEVESAYAARRPGPHVVLDYIMQSRQEAIKIVRDTAELLIHHARRQTAIQKAEKRRIKQLLRQFLPDLFSHPRQPLSDDERDDEDKEDLPSPGSPTGDQNNQENDKSNANLNQEIKQESSESDNASDKSSKNNKNNKENKPKNNNNTDHIKDNSNLTANNVKRSSSNEESTTPVKLDIKNEPHDLYDDLKDYPPNEGRFVCTGSWYVFLRVHGAICQRLASARRTALALAAEAARERPGVAAALRLKPNNLPADVSSPAEYYNVLLDLVKGVLDGNVESSAFEDASREMFGIKAYPTYTLDKLVSIAVRQLQHCASEPWSVRAAEMCARGMRGPAAYVRRAVRLLRDHHAAFLVRVYGGDECKVTFELLESAGEGRTSPQHNNDSSRLSPTSQGGCPGGVGGVGVGSTGAVSLAASVRRAGAWSAYAERYARDDCTSPLSSLHNTQHGTQPQRANTHKPVFLGRNARARAGPNTPPGTVPGTAATQPRHARRKPPRLHDAAECTLAANLRWRAVACRPFHLYQPGALRNARTTHNTLAARRRDRFRQWLRRKRHHDD